LVKGVPRMVKVRKKILILTISVIVIGGGIVGFRLFKKSFIGDLLFYDPYKYNCFCSPNGENCLTVITYTPPNIADRTFKRYVVFGKKKYKVPIIANNIEFASDTGLVIMWESDVRCKIISNLPPIRIMELSKDVRIDVVYSNKLYEQFAAKFPNSSL
jgi:hypothetical protein